MPQLFLFTGENAFALREEKIRWISEFVKKHGEENLVRLPGKSLTLRSLLDEVAVAPFIASRRLVLIEGLPPFSREEVQMLPGQVHPHVIVLIVEPKIDKRLASSKEFLSIAEVTEFPPLKGKALTQWIHATVQALGAQIAPDAVATLQEMAGDEQDMLVEELRKLALFAGSRPITSEDVRRLGMPTYEGVVWKLTDLLTAGRRGEALAFAHEHIERGGEPYGLWAVLLGMLKNVVAVASTLEGGRKDARAVAEELQLHPLAVRSLLPYASRIDRGELRRFLEQTVDADIALKTGGLRATEESPAELLALMDQFILTAPR